jgi:type I restriction enzyme R subunit
MPLPKPCPRFAHGKGLGGELKKALQFDSSDVSGVIEDLDVLLKDFLAKIAHAEKNYLEAGDEGGADEKLERIVYGRFLEPAARKAFFESYKETESLWEILSPSAELRDHIATFKRLAQLYAAVRNAYAEKVGFVADLAYKTKRLVEENATQDGLGGLTKSVTFDVKTLEALRSEKGTDEGKVFKDRAERILKDMEDRKTTGLAAMDLLAALAVEKDAADKAAKDTGLTPKAFGVHWTLKDDTALKASKVEALTFAKDVEKLLVRFPNAKVNADELRQFRAALYRPLLGLDGAQRGRIVEIVVEIVTQ